MSFLSESVPTCIRNGKKSAMQVGAKYNAQTSMTSAGREDEWGEGNVQIRQVRARLSAWSSGITLFINAQCKVPKSKNRTREIFQFGSISYHF